MTVTAVRPTEAGVEVGTFFTCSWGYDQTNVNFYKVVGLTPKGVRVQEWSSMTVEDNGPITHVVPGFGPRFRDEWAKVEQSELDACALCRAHTDGCFGEWSQTYAAHWCETHGPKPTAAAVETKRLQTYDGGISVYFSVNSYSAASPWDGRPEYETGHGWGH